MDIQSDELLHDLGLLSPEHSEPFDKLTRLASEMIGTPVFLVSIVMPDEDRQYFKSSIGLPEPWLSQRQTPLSLSFCKHVRANDAPLIVSDALSDPLVCENKAIKELGVIAYAGFPIHGPGLNAIGAFCAIDTVPRAWTATELRIIADFAAVADDQIRLLHAMHTRDLALAAEREAAAAKSQLFATISHEVRTPLSGILGMAELMLDQVSDAGQREMLEAMQASGRTLIHILSDLLEIAKFEAGKLRLERETFDIREILGQILVPNRCSAEAKGLSFMVTLDPDLPDNVVGDQHRLQQILNNLLSNAIKFTHHGDVNVSVSLASNPSGGIVFRIRDEGIGMTEDHMKRLFLPFEQADTGTTRKYGGTGLGTSIVAKLVDAMAGTIAVKSSFGEGSVFEVTLPLFAPSGEAGIPPSNAQNPSENEHPLCGRRFLVADDNATNRRLLSLMLGRAGAFVDVVENGSLAVDHALAQSYDCLLLDISMPVLDGLDALSQIDEAFGIKGRQRPPAIAITADAAPGNLEYCRSRGFDAVTTKPFSRQSLLSCIGLLIPAPLE